MLDHFKAGWEAVKPNLVGWIIFGIVVMVIMFFGIGFIFWPNVFRAVRDALRDHTAPAIGALFNFDHLVDDLVAMLVFAAGICIGLLLCIVGVIPVAILLFWMPTLAAEGRFAAIDAAKASFAHAKANIGMIVVYLLILMVINWLSGFLCGLPALVSFPVTLAAQWIFYARNRDAIMAAAQAAGVPTKP